MVRPRSGIVSSSLRFGFVACASLATGPRPGLLPYRMPNWSLPCSLLRHGVSVSVCALPRRHEKCKCFKPHENKRLMIRDERSFNDVDVFDRVPPRCNCHFLSRVCVCVEKCRNKRPHYALQPQPRRRQTDIWPGPKKLPDTSACSQIFAPRALSARVKYDPLCANILFLLLPSPTLSLSRRKRP